MSDMNSASRNGFKLVSKYRNVLMGLATIWIFIFHTWIPVFNEPDNQVLVIFHNIEEFIRKTGFYGVDLFLLLSGMGLTFAIKKEKLAKFYYRRIRRVFLPFLVAALISWPINHWSFLEFLSNVSGYTFYAKYIHIFCWFVPAIITLYLAFPLYYKLFSKAKNKFLFTSLTIVLWFLLSVVLHGIMRFDLYGFTNRIPVFVIGIYFGDNAQKEKGKAFTLKHYLVLLITFALGLFLTYMYLFKDFGIILPEAKLFLPGVLMSVSSSLLIAKLMEIIDRKVPKIGKILIAVIGFWGTISLELYCAYECLLVPYFGKAVKALAAIGLTRFPINIVIFAATSLIAFIACMLFKYFWTLVERTQKRKIVDNGSC